MAYRFKNNKKEQVVVHFAGGGGSCEGARKALGYSPHHAINHSAIALGMHRINHPETAHHIEDVFDVDPQPIIRRGGKIGLGWFSPDCRHFSKAKGGQPVEKRIRGLVLVMLRWAKVNTRVMMMENVEEIVTWGPLVQMFKGGKQGWYPDPQHAGRTWQAFVDCMTYGIRPDNPDLPEFLQVLAGITLEQLRKDFPTEDEEQLMRRLDAKSPVKRADMVRGMGYHYEARVLRGCDYGAPTIRKRLFAVFRKDRKPIVWPEQLFFDPKVHPDADRPWRTAAECIDFTIPTPSIFLNRAEAKKHGCKRPLVAATMARTARGVDRYILKSAKPFIVSLTHHGGDRTEDVDDPFKTITGAHRGEKALVTFKTAVITEHANASNQRNMPVDEPAPTVVAGGQGKTGLVAVALAQQNGGFNAVVARPMDTPVSTVTVTGSQQALIAASMVVYYGTEKDGQALDSPAPTSTTKGRLGVLESVCVRPLTPEQLKGARLVAAFLRKHGVEFEGEFAMIGDFVIVDIGLRMLTPRELFRAQGFSDDYIIDRSLLQKPDGSTYEKALTKEDQVRLCGNSVCPHVAAALISANCPELMSRSMRRKMQKNPLAWLN